MERDNRNYNREFERKLHNNDRNHNNQAFGSGDYDRNNNRDRSFENYRDRYDNHRGNYYGMSNDDYEYRNVRSTGSTAFGSGPVSSNNASSNRSESGNRDQENYRYGDPNPYMSNRRNSSGYEASRGTGWDRHDNYGTTNSNRSTNYNAGHDNDDYSRQNNSYQYSGQGRRYNDFNRDENRKMNSGDSGYNMLGIDAYTDRGDHDRSYTDNSYRRGNDSNNFYEGHYNNSERMNRGSIRNSGSSSNDDTYASGLYASNRSYNSDHRNNDNDDYDYSQRSSRYRKPGESSGPDYSADSGAGDYGYKTTRA
ncbi:hypothetical protein [Pontibacter rugosus]|uniref:SWFGD domain-containing protein n=1 Tax=Pontibacter rugosus TaxID=1745966 RepID=A0ABW3SKJ0_9BACT